MQYDDKFNVVPDIPHNITMSSRGKLNMTGITDVASFDENEIVVSTTQGTMFIRGQALHIAKLNLDGGDMAIDGTIDAIEYEDSPKGQGGFFSRIFR